MKNLLPFLFFFLLSAQAFSQVTGFVDQTSDGSSGDPIEISCVNDLIYLSQTSSYWDKYFIQTADIDFGENETLVDWDNDGTVGDTDDGSGFSPIGNDATNFTGNYNGGSYTISNVFINRSGGDYLGFFGVTNATITNLHLSQLDITGYNYIGGFTGVANGGVLTDCSSSGSITGHGSLGGFAGEIYCTVTKCSNSADVINPDCVNPFTVNIGGFVGYACYTNISECYNTGNVIVTNSSENSCRVGGFIGNAFDDAGGSDITNCYTTGNVSVSGNGIYAAGFVGVMDWLVIKNCYAAGSVSNVSGDAVIGGFTASNTSDSSYLVADFWDKTIGASSSVDRDYASGKTTAEMKTAGTFINVGWDFDAEDNLWAFNGGDNNGYPFLRFQDFGPGNIWLGTSTTAWETTENWSEHRVPADTIFIAAVSNAPEVNITTTVDSLTIETGATLTIKPTVALTVSETLINHADSTGLVIQSTASGTGRLINGTSGVRASVQQFIAEDKWHYMGLPLANSAKAIKHFKGLYVAECIEDSALHNSTRGWVYLDTTSNVGSGTGYGIYHDLDTTMTIYGTLNATEQIVPVTWRDADHGWNLISNPFPCTVDWDYVSGHSGLNNVNNAIYVYDAASESYASYVDGVTGGAGSQNQYIAPMQGFFVRSTAAGTVVFSEGAKSTGESSFKSNNLDPVIRLTVTSPNGRSDNTVIRIAAQSTGNFDGRCDAYKLLSISSATPQLYSALNGDDYSINSIPEITGKTVIPLQVMSKQPGRHAIALTELNNYTEGNKIYIENPTTGEKTEIRNNAFTFTVAGAGTQTFNLIFELPNGVGENALAPVIKAIGGVRKVYISNLGEGSSEVRILSVNGQTVYQGTVQDTKTDIAVFRSGVYLVQVTSATRKPFTGKVVVGK